MASLAKEKDAVYRLGLELRAVTGRISPDISTLSGVSTASTASTASLNSLASSDAMLDLARLSQLFPGLASRDKDATKLDIRHSNILYSVWISFAEIYNENIHDLFRKVPMNKKKRPTTSSQLTATSDDSSSNTPRLTTRVRFIFSWLLFLWLGFGLLALVLALWLSTLTDSTLINPLLMLGIMSSLLGLMFSIERDLEWK